jgi:hypothetical protein
MEEQQHSSERFEFDLPETDDVSENDYRTIPPGTYLCRVEDARSRLTKAGDRLWALHWVVDSGPEAGRAAAWDNVIFSLRAASRTKRILAALGLPNTGRVSFSADDFRGRRAIVEIQSDSYQHPQSGQTIYRNEVAYDGVRPVPEEEKGKESAASFEAPAEEQEEGADIPF